MKEILLTKGMTALIDDEDFDKVKEFKWYAHKKGRNYYYAATSVKRIYVLMHRIIMNIEDTKKHIDHINGNTLDNRKSNLRIASPKQNSRNITKKTDRNTSGFRGVFLKKDKIRPNPWCAKIRVDGKLKSLGHFKTPEEAAKAFDNAAKLYFGKFCGKLNYE